MLISCIAKTFFCSNIISEISFCGSDVVFEIFDFEFLSEFPMWDYLCAK